MLRILDGLVVSRSSGFDDIVMILGVGFECDFSIAVGAFEVKPENLNAEICLFIAYLHTHIELGADVEVVSTCIAS